MDFIVLNAVRECTSFITPKRLAQKLKIKKNVINAILHNELKTSDILQKKFISPYNHKKKRPAWRLRPVVEDIKN